jgi:hypothetical protein
MILVLQNKLQNFTEGLAQATDSKQFSIEGAVSLRLRHFALKSSAF